MHLKSQTGMVIGLDRILGSGICTGGFEKEGATKNLPV